MFPFKSSIVLDRQSNRSIYLQLCDQVIRFIKSGKLPPSAKLPGSRKLSEDLNIHRKTVIAAYDELNIQGWIETRPSTGTFVTSTLPIIHAKSFGKAISVPQHNNTSGFSFNTRSHLIRKTDDAAISVGIRIDDGVPDNRLAPIDEIARTYRNITKKLHHKKLLGYDSIYGNPELRKVLVAYLNQTRGLHISIDNILITRGSQMGIYLASQMLLRGEKRIVVGNTNYMTADNTFHEAGGIVEQVIVDSQGLNTNQIEKLCQTKKITAVYVTSHHHHPTTVTLSAERRMQLLQLSQQYHFAIIEDDYDYDFHYSHAPMLPLASNDTQGNVIYIGGFTKIIAPAIRIGYLIAPKNFIDEAARLRRIIDRQGDMVLEQTLARLISSGDVQRHCNKVLKIYASRRDLFCKLLREKLGGYFKFEVPKGGMAVWVRLDKKYNWDDIIAKAKAQQLYLNPEWRRYDNDGSGHNGIRMGFASLDENEIKEAIERLAKVMGALV